MDAPASVGGLSVVVPTRDRPALLGRCLETIARSLRPGDELIVADASSSCDVSATVGARAGRLVRCPHPGASFQRNTGAAQARNDIVAFVDDDVRVSQGWAEAVVRTFAEHPQVAFLTGRLEAPPEQAGYGRAVSVTERQEPTPLTTATTGTLGHSANMAVRRTVFERVGGFDERLGPGSPFRAAEDTDLIDRLLAAGHEGRYEPSALGWHEQWRSRPQLVKLEWSYGIGMGARLARLFRTNRRRARQIAAEYLWENALRKVPSNVIRRNEFAVAYALARVAGAVVGFAAATVGGFGADAPRARA
jgi:O-antigen biosynthesis protein